MTEGDGYNALIVAALERAQLTGKAMHVFCTAAQWVVSPQPPFYRRHIRCEPEPALVVGCAWEFERGYWSETVLWPRECCAVQREE